MDLFFPIPNPYSNKDFAQIILSSDNKILRIFPDSKGEWRYPVKLKDVSKYYIEALIGYEDQYFWYHPGVNPFALGRSAFQYLKNGKIISGGSTITMQVAKIINPHKRNLWGKAKQVFRALQLEWHYSKKDILEMYLNLAPYGGTIQGIQAASISYFDKQAKNLNPSEAALLAILPQAPSRFRPDLNPKKAINARNKLAKRLVKIGQWNKGILKDILNEPLMISRVTKPMISPLLAKDLALQYPETKTIKTFIDSRLQYFLEQTVKSKLTNLPNQTSIAIIVVDNQNMHIKGFVGSAAFGDSKRMGYINMARAIRSPGSTLKPFIYGLAIDQGLIHSQSLLIDAPRIFSPYQPANFYQSFSGPVSVQNALQKSLNVPAVQVLDHVEPAIFDASLRSVRVHLQTIGGKPNLSLAIGGTGIKLTDLVMLFSSIARGGLVEPLIYTTQDKKLDARRILSKESAYIVYEMLRSHNRPDHIFITELTGKKNPLAWKTGTSYGFRDAWAVGVTKQYTVGVWIGRPDGSPMPGLYGAITASPFLFTISDYLQRGIQDSFLQRPKRVIDVDISWPLGIATKNTPPNMRHKTITAMTIDGVAPPTLPEQPNSNILDQSYQRTFLVNNKGERVNAFCADNTTISKTVAVWPRLVERWIPKAFRRTAQIPAFAKGCTGDIQNPNHNLIITSIKDKSFITAAKIDGSLPKITLRSAGGSGIITWYINGNFVNSSTPFGQIEYNLKQLGDYQVTATDSEGQISIVDFKLIK